jgi:DNA-directed RNA polymerase subunit beta'
MEKIFLNQTLDKNTTKKLLSWFLDNYSELRLGYFLDEMKSVGFHFATKAGFSLGFDDLKIPSGKERVLKQAELETFECENDFIHAKINSATRYQRLLAVWASASDSLKDEVTEYFEETDFLNPLYMMAFSGARGNISQVRQLIGMRGLMSDSSGGVIDFPIRSNFREGLSVTEYAISCYGARKGLIDTALRTADSGYLTRRLVDVAQKLVIGRTDCGTNEYFLMHDLRNEERCDPEALLVPAEDRVLGRLLGETLYFQDEPISPSQPYQPYAHPTDLSWHLPTKLAKPETNEVGDRPVSRVQPQPTPWVAEVGYWPGPRIDTTAEFSKISGKRSPRWFSMTRLKVDKSSIHTHKSFLPRDIFILRNQKEQQQPTAGTRFAGLKPHGTNEVGDAVVQLATGTARGGLKTREAGSSSPRSGVDNFVGCGKTSSNLFVKTSRSLSFYRFSNPVLFTTVDYESRVKKSDSQVDSRPRSGQDDSSKKTFISEKEIWRESSNQVGNSPKNGDATEKTQNSSQGYGPGLLTITSMEQMFLGRAGLVLDSPKKLAPTADRTLCGSSRNPLPGSVGAVGSGRGSFQGAKAALEQQSSPLHGFENENLQIYLLGVKNEEILPDLLEKVAEYREPNQGIPIRSALTCRPRNVEWNSGRNEDICQYCYGWNLATGRLVVIGEAVGILAAQSIGEPGTQLTMRTFHTGGVFSGEVEAKVFAPHGGIVSFSRKPPFPQFTTVLGQKAFFITEELQVKISQIEPISRPTAPADRTPCGSSSPQSGLLLAAAAQLNSALTSAREIGKEVGPNFIQKYNEQSQEPILLAPPTSSGPLGDPEQKLTSILELPPYSYVFIFPGQKIERNQVCAEISKNSGIPRKAAETFTKSKPVRLEIQGQIGRPEKEVRHLENGEKQWVTKFQKEAVGSSETASAIGFHDDYIWVFSGKPVSYPRIAQSGDYISQEIGSFQRLNLGGCGSGNLTGSKGIISFEKKQNFSIKRDSKSSPLRGLLTLEVGSRPAAQPVSRVQAHFMGQWGAEGGAVTASNEVGPFTASTRLQRSSLLSIQDSETSNFLSFISYFQSSHQTISKDAKTQWMSRLKAAASPVAPRETGRAKAAVAYPFHGSANDETGAFERSARKHLSKLGEVWFGLKRPNAPSKRAVGTRQGARHQQNRDAGSNSGRMVKQEPTKWAPADKALHSFFDSVEFEKQFSRLLFFFETSAAAAHKVGPANGPQETALRAVPRADFVRFQWGAEVAWAAGSSFSRLGCDSLKPFSYLFWKDFANCFQQKKISEKNALYLHSTLTKILFSGVKHFPQFLNSFANLWLQGHTLFDTSDEKEKLGIFGGPALSEPLYHERWNYSLFDRWNKYYWTKSIPLFWPQKTNHDLDPFLFTEKYHTSWGSNSTKPTALNPPVPRGQEGSAAYQYFLSLPSDFRNRFLFQVEVVFGEQFGENDLLLDLPMSLYGLRVLRKLQILEDAESKKRLIEYAKLTHEMAKQKAERVKGGRQPTSLAADELTASNSMNPLRGSAGAVGSEAADPRSGFMQPAKSAQEMLPTELAPDVDPLTTPKFLQSLEALQSSGKEFLERLFNPSEPTGTRFTALETRGTGSRPTAPADPRSGFGLAVGSSWQLTAGSTPRSGQPVSREDPKQPTSLEAAHEMGPGFDKKPFQFHQKIGYHQKTIVDWEFRKWIIGGFQPIDRSKNKQQHEPASRVSTKLAKKAPSTWAFTKIRDLKSYPYNSYSFAKKLHQRGWTEDMVEVYVSTDPFFEVEEPFLKVQARRKPDEADIPKTVLLKTRNEGQIFEEEEEMLEPTAGLQPVSRGAVGSLDRVGTGTREKDRYKFEDVTSKPTPYESSPADRTSFGSSRNPLRHPGVGWSARSAVPVGSRSGLESETTLDFSPSEGEKEFFLALELGESTISDPTSLADFEKETRKEPMKWAKPTLGSAKFVGSTEANEPTAPNEVGSLGAVGSELDEESWQTEWFTDSDSLPGSLLLEEPTPLEHLKASRSHTGGFSPLRAQQLGTAAIDETSTAANSRNPLQGSAGAVGNIGSTAAHEVGNVIGQILEPDEYSEEGEITLQEVEFFERKKRNRPVFGESGEIHTRKEGNPSDLVAKGEHFSNPQSGLSSDTEMLISRQHNFSRIKESQLPEYNFVQFTDLRLWNVPGNLLWVMPSKWQSGWPFGLPSGTRKVGSLDTRDSLLAKRGTRFAGTEVGFLRDRRLVWSKLPSIQKKLQNGLFDPQIFGRSLGELTVSGFPFQGMKTSSSANEIGPQSDGSSGAAVSNQISFDKSTQILRRTWLAKTYSLAYTLRLLHPYRTDFSRGNFELREKSLEVREGEILKSQEFLFSQSYQESRTGDIVQGLPKIEQLFEARRSSPFTFVTLHQELKKQFTYFCEKFPPLHAARLSLRFIQRVLVDEIQLIYHEQGVDIHDKHIELIVRQMTRRVAIRDSGTTHFLPSSVVDIETLERYAASRKNQFQHYQKQTFNLAETGLVIEPVILGLTKTSLVTTNFLSAASFQEARRMLFVAATKSSVDFLSELKHDVLVGRYLRAGSTFHTNTRVSSLQKHP